MKKLFFDVEKKLCSPFRGGGKGKVKCEKVRMENSKFCFRKSASRYFWEREIKKCVLDKNILKR
jgi:hypothetical protein